METFIRRRISEEDKLFKKELFLEYLRRNPNVTKACAMAGISRTWIYHWRQEDEEFANEWKEALKIGVEALEDEMMRRAFDGVDKPIYYKGEKIDTIKQYSDLLAIFLAKGALPEKYRERIESDQNVNINVPWEVDMSEINDPDGSDSD